MCVFMPLRQVTSADLSLSSSDSPLTSLSQLPGSSWQGPQNTQREHGGGALFQTTGQQFSAFRDHHHRAMAALFISLIAGNPVDSTINHNWLFAFSSHKKLRIICIICRHANNNNLCIFKKYILSDTCLSTVVLMRTLISCDRCLITNQQSKMSSSF